MNEVENERQSLLRGDQKLTVVQRMTTMKTKEQNAQNRVS